MVVTAGFAMTGFFVEELNQRRRLLVAHLNEREEQMRLRQEAEQRIRILIETSPLAILTLDRTGSVRLANQSAEQLLGFEEGQLQPAMLESCPASQMHLFTHRRGQEGRLFRVLRHQTKKSLHFHLK